MKNINLEKQELIIILESNINEKDNIAKKLCKNNDDSFLINNENNFDSTAYDYIIYKLQNQKIKKEEINKVINELKIDKNILDYQYNQLSFGQRKIINVIPVFITNKNIIVLDNSLSSINLTHKNIILKKLKKLSKNKTIVNITKDIEDSIYGDRIILYDNGEVVLNEKTKEALKNEKVFKECCFQLPFMASLSSKLKYYDLVDNIYLDMNKLVDKLWK